MHWLSKQEVLLGGAATLYSLAGETFDSLEQATSRAIALSRRHPKQVLVVSNDAGAILSARDGEAKDWSPPRLSFA